VTNSTTNLYLVDIVSLVSSKLPEKVSSKKEGTKAAPAVLEDPSRRLRFKIPFCPPTLNTCRKRQFRGNCDRGGITHQAIQLTPAAASQERVYDAIWVTTSQGESYED
jgi:hypothetical protein